MCLTFACVFLGLFIICNKQNTEEDFREAFQKFGKIEEIYTIKDRNTGDSKGMCAPFVVLHEFPFHRAHLPILLLAHFVIAGVVYIKFSKTSEAAKALEEMNGKTLGTPPGSRPLKVLVASR